MAKGKKVATSFRLSARAVGELRELAEYLGVSQADVVEMSVREMRRQRSILDQAPGGTVQGRTPYDGTVHADPYVREGLPHGRGLKDYTLRKEVGGGR